jgi:hypothetical protein
MRSLTRAGLEFRDAGSETRRRVGHVMQHAEAVAEIHAVIGEGQRIDRCLVDRHVGKSGEALARDGKRRRRGIDAVEMPDAPGHQRRPTAAAAAGIEAGGMGRQDLPGENSEILAEHLRHLRVGDATLVETRPFGTEIPHRGAVDILAIAAHRRAL